MFEKILVLYDLSEPAKQALDWALRIGQYFQSELKVLHVLSLFPIQNQGENASVYAGMAREIRKEIDKDLRSLYKEADSGRLKEFKIKIKAGRPVPGCLNAIIKEAPDLVVMGSHGRSGLSHVFLGSVAEKIVRHSPVPVFVVKGSPQWPPKRLLIPIDVTEPVEEVLEVARSLARKIPLTIEFFYVFSYPIILPYTSESLQAQGLFDPIKLKKELEQILAKIAEKNPDLTITTRMAEGPVASRIAERAKEIQADFILIPTHGRSGLIRFFMGSVAEHVVRYSPCSVLSFCPKRAVAFRQEALGEFEEEYPELGLVD